MWRLASLALFVAWVSLGLAPAGHQAIAGRDETAEPSPPALSDLLRYVGRDPATGLPAPVDERFIAEVERGVERYGKDEREAIPPPPPSGADVATLAIPRLGVNAGVRRYGVDRFGRLDVPQDNRTVGWNPGFSPLPGKGGETFFAAHFEYLGIPGVFFRLSTLEPGDLVRVALTDGSTHSYEVTSAVDYPLGAIDMGAILFGREGTEGITLMTCSGPANEGDYAFRTVVLARRVRE